MAFIFGGLLGQNVTFEGLAAFNGSTGTNAKAFFRRALGLHFGHVMLLLVCAREASGKSFQPCWPRATEWKVIKLSTVWRAFKLTTFISTGDQTD